VRLSSVGSRLTRAVPMLAILASAGPILYMFFLLTKGSNNLHADYEHALRFIDIVMDGRLTLSSLFRANYATGHVLLVPNLIQLAVAYVFDYNVFVVIYLGFAVNIVRWLLLYDLFTCRNQNALKWALLPVLAILVFLPSQLPLYSFGFASLEYYLSHLGFVAGLWALTRFPLGWKSIALMGTSGLVASWSSGIGPLSWAIYLVVLAGRRGRRLSYYAMWLIGSAVSFMPYAYFLLIDTQRNEGIVAAPKFFDVKLMAAEIGWAFFHRANPAPGILGMALLVTGLCTLVAMLASERSRQLLERGLPALMVLLFSLLVIVQIAAFRAGFGAHRSAQFLTFWIGLAGLAYVLGGVTISDKPRDRFGRGWRWAWSRLWCVSVFVVIVVFSFQARTGEDYDWFLWERTPASASCLRHYHTAPTYCLPFLHRHELASLPFLYSLGSMSERNNLSVFGVEQQWALQGDVVLGTVHGSQDHLVWVNDTVSGDRQRWDSYERLNLLLRGNASVEWQVTLPSDMARAELGSAVRLASGAPEGSNAKGIEAEIAVLSGRGERVRAYSEVLLPGTRAWHTVSIPLTRYAGETVTIAFSSRARDGSDTEPVIYRHPVINLELQPRPRRPDRIDFMPSNTDQSERFPVVKGVDYRLDLSDQTRWRTFGVRPLPERNGWSRREWAVERAEPSFTTIRALDVCLADYAYFYIRQVADEAGGAADEITFMTEDNRRHAARLPLIGDGRLHSYTYDVKLLEWPSSARLAHVSIRVHSAGFLMGEGRIHVEEVGFIRGTASPSRCR
jgi:hypothetical protein